MAAIAFFVVVAGGSAYAAATIGSSDIKNNAVLSRHIKDGAVKNADLGASSVGTGKVIDGSLLAQDLKPGQLPQGAKQFNLHIPSGSSGQPAFGPVNGIRSIAYCNYGDSKVRVYLVQDLNSHIYVSGNESHDTTLVPVNFSGLRPGVALTGTYGDGRPGGNQSVDLDLVAQSDQVGKYTHFVIGTSNAGVNGCDFWGVITPPSN
jgi:hypothetical protein